MRRLRPIGIYLVCSFLLSFAVYRGAFWGSTILAPVDIATKLFSKYRYIDPTADHIPSNHQVIDQLTYDLPLQYTIYQALHRGEIPWWDPYTYGGRPLLADAHVNGTDPIRLLTYSALPFVPAYNWNLILKSIFTGMTMFFLLRHLKFDLQVALAFSLTYQFAGCFAIFFGHPWIEASFLYYPLLWLVWSKQQPINFWRQVAPGSLLCAAVFYSGNLQSHAYLVIFAALFVLSYGSITPRSYSRLFLLVALSGIIGSCLAAPVLLPELEFYQRSVRGTSPASYLQFLGGLASFSSFFPWAMGTFRSLDLGKFVSFSNSGFSIFVGSAFFILALLGAFRRNVAQPFLAAPRKLASYLLVTYFVICSTPLCNVLYSRIAPLAVMALIFLAAISYSQLQKDGIALPRLGWSVGLGAIVLCLALNGAAFLIYPKFLGRVHTMVEAYAKTNTSFDDVPELRSFQADNLPREISFANPETILACLSLLLLALYLKSPRQRPALSFPLLLLNFLPLFLFFARYVPAQPVTSWQKLLAGGPEQKRVASILNPNHLRLLEQAPGLHEMLFPNNLGLLQKVHTVHGYSALQPVSIYGQLGNHQFTPDQIADYRYTSTQRGQAVGLLEPLAVDGPARFHADERSIKVEDETLDTLKLSVAPGPSTSLLRTDTYYPGWQVEVDGHSTNSGCTVLCFSRVELPSSAAVSTVVSKYRPTHLVLSLGLAAGTLVMLSTLAVASRTTAALICKGP